MRRTQGPGKHANKRTSSTTRVLLVLALAMGIIPLMQGVASAHNIIVNGTVVCNAQTGDFDITWSVRNSQNKPGQDMTLTASNRASVPIGSAFAPGQTRTFSESVPGSSGDQTLSVTGRWEYDGFTASGSATVHLTGDCDGGSPHLTFAKSGPATVDQGGLVTYTISVTNDGTAPSQPVTVSDNLDNLYSNVQASSSVGTCQVSGGDNVSCAIGVLDAGQSATITITATAPSGRCPKIHNVASVQQGTQPAESTNQVSTQVTGCGPDVSFSKSGPATVGLGGQVSYQIGVTNGGTADSDPITVSDSLDPAYSNVQASSTVGSCQVSGNDVTCSVGVLAAGQSATITITATAPDDECPTIDNVASVQQGEGSPTQTNTVTTEVTGCEPDVEISKSAGQTTVVEPGQSFSYTITVSSEGEVTADNVVVTDTIPAGLTIDSVSPDSCDVSGQLVTCQLGDLEPGQSVTITINVTATEGACPSITNSAHVEWFYNRIEESYEADSNQVTVGVNCEPGISVIKEASETGVDAGGDFFYTITVSNTGDATAQDVVVTDTIDADLNIQNVIGPGCQVNGQVVTCAVGDLAPGQAVQITIFVSADDEACPGVDNAAVVTWGDGETQGGRADSNTVHVDVDCEPGIGITKSASVTTALPGDQFSYTISVTNTGNAPANGVVVTDTVPAGLTIVSVQGTGCSVSGQTVTCNVGTIQPGATITILITVQAGEGACPNVTNHAHVTYSEGPEGGQDSNPVTVGVNCETDLQIVKNSDAPSGGVESGDSFTYTITVTNDGDATATGVVVTDVIPDGLTIDQVDGPGCVVDGQVVTCDVGDIAPGASVTITIEVTADDDACPAVENSATVTWDGGESSEESNTVETDVDCVGGETVTPPPTTPPDGTTTTPPGGTAFTGPAAAIPLAGLALILLTLGTGLMWLGRRRRQGSEG
jgi:uncharacterized repeat protein (TIGR01451 family)